MAIDEITLHYADEDPNTTPYASLATATIAGYTGAGSVNIRVYDPGQIFALEGDETTYINGEIRGKTTFRKEFELVVVPFSYKASSWDVGDLDAVITALRKNSKWIALNAYSTQFARNSAYHTVSHAIPVELTDFNHTKDRQHGTESISIKFRGKWEE